MFAPDIVCVTAPYHRIVILSDTHLGPPGRGAVDAANLRPLWRGADELILNGDIAELQDVAHRAAAARQVMKIQALCEIDGVTLTMLPGNHDPMLSDRRHLDLCGGEVFVTHGDALHPAISPWTEERRSLRRLHDDAAARLGVAPDRDAKLSIAQFASHLKWEEMARQDEAEPSALRRKWGHAMKIARVLWYWHTLPRAASDFARKYCPHARFFVFGHIHRAGVWKLGGRILINTGSYDFPRNPQAVVIEAGQLRVYKAQRRDDGTYHLAATPHAHFPLHGEMQARAA